MGFFQAIILAIIQGLTEFLPVSSSGHLVVLQKLFNLTKPPVLFDILVHVGTLGAVIIYFRKELLKISRRTIWLIIVGTIPAVIAGLFLQSYIEQIFNSLKLVGLALLVTAGFLFATQRFKSLNRQFNKVKPSASFVVALLRLRRSFGSPDDGRGRLATDEIKWLDAIIIGCFQALAILPGISRSGLTITSGLWRKLDRETAFRFSFYLAIPAILGALILQIPAVIDGQLNYLNQGILGMFIAGVVGYGALRILEKTLINAKFWIFGIYCLILGIIVLFI